MPSGALKWRSDAPSGPGWGHPAGDACEALRGPPGAPPKAGWGVRLRRRPEQLRNVGVAKIPELKM